MKQVVLKKGLISVKDVATPVVESGNLLIKVVYSCISAGTEMSAVAASGKSLLERVRQKPENIKKAIALVKRNGVNALFKKLEKIQDEEQALGYSVSGVVIGVGEGVRDFCVGDRVAAAGAGMANHAEFASIPQNLAVRVPDEVSLKDASSVALGSIAMQGVRRTDLRLGEICVVVGAGIMGLLAIQMLHASGVRVIAVDYSDHRLAVAKSLGAEMCVNPKVTPQVEAVENFTKGYGADAVLFAAATSDNSAISNSFKMCKRKGKVVLLGVAGLNIDRNDMYLKELDFQLSTSYGPGRYDDKYELKGLDYPYAYVRWTEGRNMQEFLRLIGTGAVSLQALIEKEFPFENAAEAFASLQGPNRPLIVVLNYGEADMNEFVGLAQKTIPQCAPCVNAKKDKKILNVGLIGVGAFAEAVHVPNLMKLQDRFCLYGACAHNGLKVKAFGEKHNLKHVTTDPVELINDPEIDVILIATRHDTHADFSLKALKAGKNVFVEKPAAVTEDELNQIREFFREKAEKGEPAPIYQIGYNRSFSPSLNAVAKLLTNHIGPVQLDYSINAGFIPADHWTHDDGGRIVGEGCHFIDFASALIGKKCTGISGFSGGGDGSKYLNEDNKFFLLRYEDGSVATLRYFTTGAKDYPKELISISCDGKTAVINDFKGLTVYGGHCDPLPEGQDKGHYAELVAFANAVRDGKQAIPLERIFETTELSFLAAEL